jgi:hypothetical protein
MFNTAPYIMLLMRATSITRPGGRGLALEIETFLGPVKYYRAVRPPTCPRNGFARIENITDKTVSIRGPYVVICTIVHEIPQATLTS